MMALWMYFWPPYWPLPSLIIKPSANVGGSQQNSVKVGGGTGDIASAGGTQRNKGSIGN